MGFVQRSSGMKIKYLPPSACSKMANSLFVVHSPLGLHPVHFSDKEPASVPQPSAYGHDKHTARPVPAK